MFFAKMSGAVLMVVVFSYMGHVFSQRYIERYRQLLALRLALEILNSEILYMKTPLPLAFKKIALRMSEPVSGFFSLAAAKLDEGGYFTREAWQEAIEEKYPETCLQQQDIYILNQLGVVLEGDADSEGQVRQLKLLERELARTILEAEEEKRKNVRVWRYLGLLGGLSVVILFF